MTIGAAGVNPDRQIMLFSGFVDRPINPAPKRHVAHCRDQHLDKPAVGGEPLNFADRKLRVVHRQQNGGAQTRLPVQQFLRRPVIDGRA